MFLGYSLMWLAIVLYVANLGRRQGALHREIAQLHAELDRTVPEAGPAEDPAAAAGARSGR
jgi:CcmD family protein